MSDIKRKLTDNIRKVNDRIVEACDKARRDPTEVKLVAVTKYVGLDVIKCLVELGFPDLGESRVHELARRAAMVNEFAGRRGRDPSAGGISRPSWHLVGHLQRNKIKAVLPWIDVVHSVDSLRLAETLDAQACKLERTVDILLQVNCSADPSKFGVAVGAATHLAENIASLPNLSLCGLMTMAPLTDDRGVIYDCFTRCYELYDEIVHEVGVGEQFRHLSMGMSGDFDIAIATGATIVRIGSALFEGIPRPDPASVAPEGGDGI